MLELELGLYASTDKDSVLVKVNTWYMFLFKQNATKQVKTLDAVIDCCKNIIVKQFLFPLIALCHHKKQIFACNHFFLEVIENIFLEYTIVSYD